MITRYCFLICWCLLVTVCSCSDEAPTEKVHAEVKPIRSKPKKIKENSVKKVQAASEKNDPLDGLYQQLLAQYDHVIYYFQRDTQYLFYVVNGDWVYPEEIENGEFPHLPYKMGLVNHQLQTLIPVQYDVIYSPEATVEDLILVADGSKRGAYNWKGEVVIPVQYDAIYPYFGRQKQVLAKLRKGNQYGWANRGGMAYFDPQNAPLADEELYHIDQDIKKWTFNTDRQFDLALKKFRKRRDQDYQEAAIFSPDYLVQSGLAPEVFSLVSYYADYDGSETGFGFEIKSIQKLNEKIKLLFGGFSKWGLDGRGWHLDQEKIISLNDTMLEMGKVMIEEDGYPEMLVCDEPTSYRFLRTDLLEIREMVHSPFPLYDQMIHYRYYRFEENGVITDLDLPRQFDFTRYIELQPDYFKFCCANKIKVNEENAEELQIPNYVLTDHLSSKDFDIMVNEIFAEYGYIFKDDSWTRYFNQFEWYIPKYDNVDDQLTETEKRNVEFIRSFQKDLKKNESSFIKRDSVAYYPLIPG